MFPGEADEVPDKNAGTLHFKVRTAPHRLFTRQGNDLHHAATISLQQVGGDVACV